MNQTATSSDIITKVNEAKLCWSGVGGVRYPRNLSRRVIWLGKAEDLDVEPALVAHDWFTLDPMTQPPSTSLSCSHKHQQPD
jgi:hypothetical protein